MKTVGFAFFARMSHMPRAESLLPVVLALSFLQPGRLLADNLPASTLPRRPNIVILLADDLGWADVGYHSDRCETPHIDRLCQEGIELDRFYVAPMCSPTRAALLTGRYPIRFGMARAVIPPYRDFGIPPQERTLPEELAKLGYEHRAIFGKWHLGHRRAQWHPLNHGFTHFQGHYNGAIDYFTQEREGQRDWHINREPDPQSGYSTDLIADAAVKWIEEKSRSDSPYICYVPFNAPHSPFQAKSADLVRFQALGGNPDKVDGKRQQKLTQADRRLAVAAMIYRLDQGIGRILRAVEDSGEAENTIVWFFSDNGGVGALPNNNLPLRGNKLDVFEGGIRVPACVRWPARWQSGTKVSQPIHCMDILPTLLAAARRNPENSADESGLAMDGIDVSAMLSAAGEPMPGRDLYSYHGQQGPDKEKIAVTTPSWKLVVLGPDLSEANRLTDAHQVALFRFPGDLLEKQDLSRQHPVVVEELTAKLIQFRKLQPAKAVLPYATRNPSFEPHSNWRIPDK